MSGKKEKSARTGGHGRVVTLGVLFVALLASLLLVRSTGWRGSDEFVIAMEVVSIVVALFVGLMGLVRFYSKKNNVSLFVGTGFLGTAFLDSYHAVATYSYVANGYHPGLAPLVSWSWLVSRTFLGLFLLLSWVAWRREKALGEEGMIGERTIYFAAASLTVVSFFFSVVPPPQTYFEGFFVPRPMELLPAGFFLAALIGYLRKGDWRHDGFERWLVLSLVAALGCQAAFLTVSDGLSGKMHCAAYLLKNLSYLLALGGLVASMYRLFKQADESARTLRLVNKELEVANAERKRMAYFDSLTQLPNRHLLKDRLSQAISQARRTGKILAVVFLDLDRFKIVNDSFGHAQGDFLLQSVAERLRASLRESDTIARIGGDEFIIIITNIESGQDAVVPVRRIEEGLSQPIIVKDHEVFVTTSVGISLYPEDGEDIETLIKNADVAMYRVKERGGDGFAFYTPDMTADSFEHLALESNLRKALQREEFRLLYQPLVDMGSGEIVALEALMRWQHPELGEVLPAQFVPLAERTGLIAAMGEWALFTVCKQIRAWRGAGLSPRRVMVNVSGRQFKDGSLVEAIGRALEEWDLDHGCLGLELTESSIMQNPESSLDALAVLRGMGVDIAIDDFGTGYSSLGYLSHMPVDLLKIDMSFVHGIGADPGAEAIVKAIISLAHNIGIKVVAEGVETAGQLDFLREHGCDIFQGYYFCRPMTAAELTGTMLERPPVQEARLDPFGQYVMGV